MSDDYANNTSTTGYLAVGGSTTGNLEVMGDRDWFAIDLQAGAQYRFNLNGNTLSDTYLRLLNSNGNLIAQNDDANNSTLNSAIVFTANRSGRFYLAAGAYGDFGRGTYTLSSTLLSAAPVDDYADNTSTTGYLAVGGSTTGNLEVRGDRDWFAIDLQAGAQYRFNLNGNTLSDTYLRLLNSNGNLIAENDDANSTLNSAIVFTADSSGRFYLSAGAYGDSGTGTYTLSSTLLSLPPQPEPQPEPQDPGETIDSALDLGNLNADGILQTSDSVGNGDPRDFYRFQVDTSLYVVIRLTDLSSDIDIVLRNSSGTAIIRSENSRTSDEVISSTLNAGIYYLEVYPYSGSSSYNLELTASIPPQLPDNYSAINGYGETRVDLALGELLGITLPSVPSLGGNSWGLDRIGAPEAWAMGYTGEGRVVAVLDTGVDWSHLSLSNNIWSNITEISGNSIDDDGNGYIDDVRGWDFAYNDNNPNDVDGHGTHVAGIVASVAPDVLIMPVKVLGDDGSGSTTNIAAGIRYAADNGANVINMSLGGGGVSPEINNAIDYATARGTLVVMAAGNAGGSSPEQPGAYAAEHGLVVGAIDSNGNIASFSNRAGSAPQDYNGDGLAFPSYVTAAGVNVYSTIPGGSFASYSGTSMAAPHVAGAAAIVMGASPSLSPTEVADIITGTAVLGASNFASLQQETTSLQTAGKEDSFYAWV